MATGRASGARGRARSGAGGLGGCSMNVARTGLEAAAVDAGFGRCRGRDRAEPVIIGSTDGRSASGKSVCGMVVRWKAKLSTAGAGSSASVAISIGPTMRGHGASGGSGTCPRAQPRSTSAATKSKRPPLSVRTVRKCRNSSDLAPAARLARRARAQHARPRLVRARPGDGPLFGLGHGLRSIGRRRAPHARRGSRGL